MATLNSDKLADVFGQTHMAKTLVNTANHFKLYPVIITHQKLTSSHPLHLLQSLTHLQNTHGSPLFLVLVHPDHGVLYHPHDFSHFQCFHELPLHLREELRQSADTVGPVADALHKDPISLGNYFLTCGTGTDCQAVVSLCQLQTEQLDIIELSSSRSVNWAVIGGLDFLSTVFDTVKELPLEIDEKCIFFIRILKTQTGINWSPIDSLKLLSSIFQCAGNFPNYVTDGVIKKIKETVEAMEGFSKESTKCQKLFKFLCHIGEKIEPSMKTAVIGFIFKIQDSVTDHMLLNIAKMVVCMGIQVSMLSSLVMKPKKKDLPSTSIVTAGSSKDKKLENISNVLAAGGFFVAAIVLFTSVLLKIPLSFAVCGVMSCFAMLISAAIYGYV